MIRHIALFIVKEQFNGTPKADLIRQIQSNTAAMAKEIKAIKSIEARINYQDASCLFSVTDLCILADFDSLEGYQSYFHHEAHQKAAAFAAEVSNYVTSICYEVES